MANPRGNPQNLVQNRLNTEETRKHNSRAGKKSAAVKKEYKTFQECFKSEMTPEMRKELFDVLYKRAKAGNLKAVEMLRDTMGEKPTEKVVVNTVSDEAIDGLKAAIEKRRATNG